MELLLPEPSPSKINQKGLEMFIKKIKIFISGILILSFFAFIVVSNHGQIFAAATLTKDDGKVNLDIPVGGRDNAYTITSNLSDYPVYGNLFIGARSEDRIFKYTTGGAYNASDYRLGGQYGGNGMTTDGKYIYLYDIHDDNNGVSGIYQINPNTLDIEKVTPYHVDWVDDGDIAYDGQYLYTTNYGFQNNTHQTCRWSINPTTRDLSQGPCIDQGGSGMAFDGTFLYFDFTDRLSNGDLAEGIMKVDNNLNTKDSVSAQTLYDNGVFTGFNPFFQKFTANEQYIFGNINHRICKWSVGNLSSPTCETLTDLYSETSGLPNNLTIANNNGTDYLYVSGYYSGRRLFYYDFNFVKQGEIVAFRNNDAAASAMVAVEGSFKVVDTVPDGTTFVSSAGGDGGNRDPATNKVTWRNLNTNGSTSLTLTVNIGNPSSLCPANLNNTATLYMADVKIADATDTTLINCAATFTGVTVLVTWPEGPNIGKVEIKTKLQN